MLKGTCTKTTLAGANETVLDFAGNLLEISRKTPELFEERLEELKKLVFAKKADPVPRTDNMLVFFSNSKRK